MICVGMCSSIMDGLHSSGLRFASWAYKEFSRWNEIELCCVRYIFVTCFDAEHVLSFAYPTAEGKLTTLSLDSAGCVLSFVCSGTALGTHRCDEAASVVCDHIKMLYACNCLHVDRPCSYLRCWIGRAHRCDEAASVFYWPFQNALCMYLLYTCTAHVFLSGAELGAHCHAQSLAATNRE
jgi:hypothetical protein